MTIFTLNLYPFLAMSFTISFHRVRYVIIQKSDTIQKDDLLNPYDVKSNDFRFSYTPYNIDFSSLGETKV
ncbi:MAG: hypothetical protein Q9M40_01705 [Sulfurimonas sp.]|nr:hypothetical protein [Sulfurimonas sp.]